MIFQHFFWDYDGTLFDTYDAVTRSYELACRGKGIVLPFDELRWMTKHSLSWTAAQLEQRFGVPAKELLAIRETYAETMETFETMRPYDGVREALRTICEKGGKNYLYSHRDHRSMEALAHYGLDGYFTDAITKDDAFPRKPAPDALNHLVQKHKLDVAQCIMIGDRSLDVEAGLNAGMSGALFDPERFCDNNVPTKWKFYTMSELQKALIDA